MTATLALLALSGVPALAQEVTLQSILFPRNETGQHTRTSMLPKPAALPAAPERAVPARAEPPAPPQFFAEPPLFQRRPNAPSRPRWTVTTADVEALQRIIYCEARGEPIEGQYMVAYVLLLRAHFNRSYWGGDSIRSVAFRNSRNRLGGITWQFTCAKDADRPMTDQAAAQRAWDIALDVLQNGYQPPGALACATYYMWPRKSDPHNVIAFRRSYRYAGRIGHHEFYCPKDDPYGTIRTATSP